ncbi:hypothetical protein CBR_g23360 [Chara braunii]|uniref:Glycosyltransferase family 34 protein n=1 Tax=Chara braunii TaxID=69332 RepID=A0A388L3Z8_CHABU|nr:hypothetical protein CBR_g23360 [Chara braunii]|eukprot:GBG77034.1 hypothetical protein CBR_g23360 [Chara braunii]
MSGASLSEAFGLRPEVQPSLWSGQRLAHRPVGYVERVLRGATRPLWPHQTPQVLLVSASQPRCSTPRGDNHIVKSLKNKADYARKHGFATWFSMEGFVDPPYHPPYHHRLRNKVMLLRHLLRTHSKHYDWLFWIDSDAIITDMSFRVPWDDYVLHGYSVVLWGSPSGLDSAPSYQPSLSTGVLLLRNDQYSREFLEAIVQLWGEGEGEKYRDDGGGNRTAGDSIEEEVTVTDRRMVAGMPSSYLLSDQSSAIYLLATQRERWLPRVFLEARYHINRYWREVSHDLERYYQKGAWVGDGLDPPFIVHFCGCALCWRRDSAQLDECQAQHERTFHFADDQIIKELGYRHRNLSTPEIVSLDCHRRRRDIAR